MLTLDEQLTFLAEVVRECRKSAKRIPLPKYKRVQVGIAYKDSIIACLDGALEEIKNLQEHLK
jgi:hypothetical protein